MGQILDEIKKVVEEFVREIGHPDELPWFHVEKYGGEYFEKILEIARKYGFLPSTKETG